MKHRCKQIYSHNCPMKKIKFISAVFFFLLAFISRAECSKYFTGLEKLKSHTSFISCKIQINSALSRVQTKDLDFHFVVKKKIKYRATTSESITLRTPYLIKLVNFKIFKNRLMYGIASIYQIQRYTYLHLYQLF